jgi:hypothetical protein
MAGPHVAGLAALLLSARSELIGQVGEIEHLISASAVPVASNSLCGGIPDSVYPNNSSGWGRVDALFALMHGEFEVFYPLVTRR